MLLHLGGDLLGVLPDHLQVGADDPDGDRRRRAEAHDRWSRCRPARSRRSHSLACRFASAGDSPPCSSRLASQGITRSGRTLRSRSRNSSSLIPLSSVQRDAQLAVVGPAHEQHHVVDAEVRRHLADVAHRDLRCSRARPRARSPRGTSPPSAASARSWSRAAAGTAARTAPNRSAGTTRCRPAAPARQRIRPHAAEVDRHDQPAQADEPVHQPCRRP